jgi:hypothetical protein
LSTDPALRQAGVLELLKLPALHGQRHPELAAAALFDAMQSFAQSRQTAEQAAVRRELLSNYSQSWHAAKVRAELSRKSDP